MCFCLITICFHMPNVFYLFIALLLICQRWPMIGLIKVFYSILFYSNVIMLLGVRYKVRNEKPNITCNKR